MTTQLEINNILVTLRSIVGSSEIYKSFLARHIAVTAINIEPKNLYAMFSSADEAEKLLTALSKINISSLLLAHNPTNDLASLNREYTLDLEAVKSLNIDPKKITFQLILEQLANSLIFQLGEGNWDKLIDSIIYTYSWCNNSLNVDVSRDVFVNYPELIVYYLLYQLVTYNV